MPVRSQNANDWLNPIALALGTGLFVGLPSGWVISSLFPRLSLGAGLAIGFIVISGAVWLWRLGVYDTLLVMRENREKEAPPEKEDKPDPPVVKVEIESKDGEGYRAFRFADLPASRRKGFAGLNRFAGAVTSQGESFAERQAADFGGYNRQEWQTLRGIFLDRGWAAWNDPQAKNQGITLTAAGRAIVRKIATSPLPREHGREI